MEMGRDAEKMDFRKLEKPSLQFNGLFIWRL